MAGLNTTELLIFENLRKTSMTIKQIELATTRSNRMIRYALEALISKGLVRELPQLGREKIYAAIDYIPLPEDTSPDIRFTVYQSSYKTNISLGQIAEALLTRPSAGMQSSEWLLKLAAWFMVLATKSEDPSTPEQLANLRTITEEAVDVVTATLNGLQQLLADKRLWEPQALAQLAGSSDYIDRNLLPAVIKSLEEG